MDTQPETNEYNSIHLNTLPPFDDEVKAAAQPQITSRKFKIRCAQSIATSSPGAPIRKFQIGGKNRLRASKVSQSVKRKPQDIPRITVTEPLEPPSDLENHPETDNHQPASSSFLEVPFHDPLTPKFEETLVFELDFDQGNFAPSSPRGKGEWLNQWAEKGGATRRRATLWTIDPLAAKEAMRVAGDKMSLPAITTKIPRARRLDTSEEDYGLKRPESAVYKSSQLGQWREEDDESFDLLEEDDELEKMGSLLRNEDNHTTLDSYEQSPYDIIHYFDELYDWENDKNEKTDIDQDEMITQEGNIKGSTESTTKDSSEKLDHTAFVAELCQKWGPDRFERWCEEYATPISEAMWDEAAIGLEEFLGSQSEPSPVQDQNKDADQVILTPRRHSFPRADPPPRGYLRTRRSMQTTQEQKDDVVTRLSLMRLRLERWSESRDNRCYDGDFQDFEEDE